MNENSKCHFSSYSLTGAEVEKHQVDGGSKLAILQYDQDDGQVIENAQDADDAENDASDGVSWLRETLSFGFLKHDVIRVRLIAQSCVPIVASEGFLNESHPAKELTKCDDFESFYTSRRVVEE
jgi:hypothetical protein